MTAPIYLDYNGTTPHDAEVISAMLPYLETVFGNPSSSHFYGVAPQRAVEKARQQVADLLNCKTEEIVFTSGGTESNNHALRGISGSQKHRDYHLITSVIEHPAILDVCQYLEEQGVEVSYLSVDNDGQVDPREVEKAIRPTTRLISIMHANNEVGTIQPIAEISAIAKKHGVLFHTDAAQSAGKISTDVDLLGVDLLSLAGHKIYGPKGIGVLYIRSDTDLKKFCFGAGQERGLRAGTENVMAIVGLGKACEIARLRLNESKSTIQTLRDTLWQGLYTQLSEIRLVGHPQNRLPNTLSISFKGLEANRILDIIGERIAASAGAACHSDTVQISHVLQAMELPIDWAKGTIRLSLGRMTTAEEVATANIVIVDAIKRLRQAM